MHSQAVMFFLNQLSKVKLEGKEYSGIPNRIVDNTFLELVTQKATERGSITDPILIKLADIVDIEPIGK